MGRGRLAGDRSRGCRLDLVMSAFLLVSACSPSKPAAPDRGATGGGAAQGPGGASGTGGTAGGPGGAGHPGAAGAGGWPASGAGGVFGSTGGVGGTPSSAGGAAGLGGSRPGAGGAGLPATGGAPGSGGAGGAVVLPSGCNAAGQWEPNDIIGQACPIPLKTLIQSTLGTADSEDYYSFPAAAGDRFAVNFWNTTPASNGVYVAASLITSGQTVPLLSDNGVGPNGVSYFELPATMAGTMILRIHQPSAITYKFSVVSCADPGQDPVTFEPNNTACSAAPLTLGTNIETQLGPPEDTADYFDIPVTKDHWNAFTFTIAASNPGIYLSAVLNPQTGQPTTFLPQVGYGAGTTFKEFQASSTGTVVFDFQQAGVSIYDFVVYPSTADGLVHDAKYEPNNTPHTAAPLALGQQVSSDLNTSTDYVDYFQLNVTGGVPYVATFSNTAAAGGIYFSVSTLEGVSLVNQVGVGSSSLNNKYTFTPQADATVVVQLQTSQAATTYNLQVSPQ